MPPESPRGLRLRGLAVPPALAAYFYNSAIYFELSDNPGLCTLQSAKKVSFTAFPLGKLWQACTTLKVIFTNLKKFLMSKINNYYLLIQ